MSADTSRWRFAEDYAYLDTLCGADLAWEYLRRNPDYQTAFLAASQDPEAGSLDPRWGLRFPGRSVA